MLPTDDKERKALPIFTWLTEYFPDAIVECVRVSVQGNIQHNPELAPADIRWDRGKSTDQLNTAFRHMLDHKRGTVMDDGGKTYHLAKAAWRILAELQLTIERERADGGEFPAFDGTITGLKANPNGTLSPTVRTSPIDPRTGACYDCDQAVDEGEQHLETCQHFRHGS